MLVMAKHRTFLNPATEMGEARAAKNDAVNAVNNWLRLVMPDDTFYYVLSSSLFYKLVLEDTPPTPFGSTTPTPTTIDELPFKIMSFDSSLILFPPDPGSAPVEPGKIDAASCGRALTVGSVRLKNPTGNTTVCSAILPAC